MRVLVDPETGETVEHLPGDVGSVEPYTYEEAKRAVLQATRERRELERRYSEAQDARAEAEAEYRRILAGAILTAKDEHGATVAEKIAKGQPAVVDAKRETLKAEGKLHAIRSRLALCAEDRASLHRLIEWSRDVWRYEEGLQG